MAVGCSFCNSSLLLLISSFSPLFQFECIKAPRKLSESSCAIVNRSRSAVFQTRLVPPPPSHFSFLFFCAIPSKHVHFPHSAARHRIFSYEISKLKFLVSMYCDNQPQKLLLVSQFFSRHWLRFTRESQDCENISREIRSLLLCYQKEYDFSEHYRV